MAKKQCCFFITVLPAFLLFCCVRPTLTVYTAQTPSQAISLLSSYSSPMNHTTGKRFLKDVRDSEVGLCLGLSNAQNTTFVAGTSLVVIHVRQANYSSVSNTPLQFPCSACPTLVPRSPLVELIFKNDTLPSISCLAASRFSNDFSSVDQNPLRLSDVLSLSFYDPHSSVFINLSTSDVINLHIPLARTPNNSFHYTLECYSQEWNSSDWSNNSCSTNQTIKMNNNSPFVQCRCSTLGFFAVFVRYSAKVNGGSSSEGPVVPTVRMSLKLDADCQRYLSNNTIKANFLNATKYSIATALNTSVSNIYNMEALCGSIVVNFTLMSGDGTNETITETVLRFGHLVKSDLFKVSVDNTKIFPFTLWILDVGLNMSQLYTSPHFYRKYPTTPTTQPTKIEPLVIDYKPLIIAVSVVVFAVVICVCSTCCSHSWYLRKKKYTEFNSDKVVPEVEVPVVEEEEDEEEEVAAPEFPMTYTKRPKVNERQMARYDWARTSFAQEENNLSAFVTPQAGQGPRLIMDCESDEETEDSPTSDGESLAMEIASGSEIDSGSGRGKPSDGDDAKPKSSLSEERADASQNLMHSKENVASESREAFEEPVKWMEDDEGREENQEMNNNRGEGDCIGNVHDQDEAKENDGGSETRQIKDEDNEGTNEDSEGSPKNERPATSARGDSASSKLDEVMIANQGMPEPCM